MDRPHWTLRGRALRTLVVLLTLAVAWVGTPPAGSREEDPFQGDVTGLRCDSDADARFCTGFLAGFDGTALDVDLALPAQGPYPLLAIVHGWGGSKGGGGASSSYPGDEFLTERGYAVLRYSARGFGDSWGQTHLASLRWEIRDLRSLVSQVVDDDRFAVTAKRIGVTGASYGGGHSWLAATKPRWKTPGGTAVRIAAVAPIVPWTDLVYSLVPNGRPGDSRAVVGTGKETYVTALFAGGARSDPDRPYPNYIPLLPELYARFSAGEPYEADGVRDPIIQKGLEELSEDRSVAWQKGWLRRLRGDPSTWVPVLDVQGWTDDLFPATEAVRMYRLLRQVSRDYPIKLYFGDVGHPRAANKPAETDRVLDLLIAWFDYWLRDVGKAPRFNVTAATTSPGDFDPSLVVRERRFWNLWDRRLSLEAGGPFVLSAHPWNAGGMAADPIVGFAAAALVDPLAPHLVEAGQLTPGGAVAIERKVEELPGGQDGLWYLGRGSVSFQGTLAGSDAQYDVRVWDRGPDGTLRLVDRGTFKQVGAPGPVDIRVPLFGNGWLFRPGHELMVELTNVDTPFLRANNLPSITVIDRVAVDLPIRHLSG